MQAASASPPATATLDLIRTRLGDRYALERELGRGGMGTVYLARDLRLDRPIALKVLPPEFAMQAALRDRFLLETRTAAKFSHPNIVPVYAVEESEDLLAYTMALVEGDSLADRVQRVGPLSVREIVRLLQDVGYALAYAHGRGVVHRDIKPENVMLERATGRALVMDFGISRSILPVSRGSPLTRVGEVVGTPEYMSPEQASGDQVDGRSDLYALGLTAHFAATGRMTMTADTTQKVLVKQLTEQVPPIVASRPDLPPVLSEAIDRCVQKDPEHRFATAEELIEAIDAGQLAEPEIPLPIRLFAGEASALSMVAIGILLLSLYMVESGQQNNVGTLDIVLPIVGLLAVLLTRVLTTLSEARRLAIAGFSANEVMAGLSRVVAERGNRRDELRADPANRHRRRITLGWALVMLPMSAVMIWAAFQLRVQVGPTAYSIGPLAMVLVTSGVVLLGIGMVLLIQSPFRIPAGERLFRLVWLGLAGRLFVRFAGRKVRTASIGAGVRLVTASAAASGSVSERPLSATSTASPPTDRMGALEARVADLERWRGES